MELERELELSFDQDMITLIKESVGGQIIEMLDAYKTEALRHANYFSNFGTLTLEKRRFIVALLGSKMTKFSYEVLVNDHVNEEHYQSTLEDIRHKESQNPNIIKAYEKTGAFLYALDAEPRLNNMLSVDKNLCIYALALSVIDALPTE